MKRAGKLNIVIALSCEARFFLDKYRLKKIDHSGAFQIFADVEKRIHLIISGIGKIKSAAATAYLHAFTGAQECTCYLNAGIAGGGEKNIGDLFLVHKITDAATENVFYPLPVLSGYLSSFPVLTVDRANDHYSSNQLIDMESAGFFTVAIQFVTQEQVQILKIVSDHCAESMKKISPESVIAWFRNQQELIDRVVQHQLQLSDSEFHHQIHLEYYEQFISTWRFSAYQKNQLRELLRRWSVNFPLENPFEYSLQKKSSKDVLVHLER